MCACSSDCGHACSLGDLSAPSSSEFSIKFHLPLALPPLPPSLLLSSCSSPSLYFLWGPSGRASERLSHQLIKSLTADSSWGLAAAAGGGGGGGGEQTDIAWCQKNGGKKHDAKSAVFCRRDDDDDDATRGDGLGADRGGTISLD